MLSDCTSPGGFENLLDSNLDGIGGALILLDAPSDIIRLGPSLRRSGGLGLRVLKNFLTVDTSELAPTEPVTDDALLFPWLAPDVNSFFARRTGLLLGL